MRAVSTPPSRLTYLLYRAPWSGLVVWSAVVFVVAASVARSFVEPLLRYDEPGHLDYVLSVWNGHLPVFEDGLTHQAPFGWDMPVQWTAQHPPLYYLLLAPVVGPLFDADHALVAVIAGRLVGALITGGVVLGSAWTAARCFPAARRLPGGVAVVTSLCGQLIQQGGQIYNDVLFVFLLVLACGIAGAAIRSGVGPGLLTAATLVGAAGMTTRLSFGLWLVALVVSIALARRVQLWRLGGIWARIVATVLPLAGAGLASGWFYLRNKALSGNISGRHVQWGLDNLNRTERPHVEVATSSGFWSSLFALYRSHLNGNDPLQWVLLLGPIVLGIVLGLMLLLVRRVNAGRATAVAGRRPRRGDRIAPALVVAMFATVSVLLIVVEIDYVHGGGAPITRYALTMLPVVTIMMAAGLTAFRRSSGPLLTVWTVAAFVAFFSQVELSADVDLRVPHAALVSRTMLVVCVVATLGIVVGGFLDARRPLRAGAPRDLGVTG
ncbi:hypothetical protein LQK89_10725 [Curtobacterium sp. C1]|uniref:hypothetical protein n=1 Tax=Curtobacterium TaxID=2034 RepID=UPI001E520616|nr:hypothetical protein [Curtobacterium sp. C1]MCS5487466.1 hypothetical protein [Curtobacterium flaccumfaciens pv. basellae]UFU13015.1 hypothetical protein LQK89_10725 [Curtobacterium sp. C1]